MWFDHLQVVYTPSFIVLLFKCAVRRVPGDEAMEYVCIVAMIGTTYIISVCVGGGDSG